MQCRALKRALVFCFGVWLWRRIHFFVRQQYGEAGRKATVAYQSRYAVVILGVISMVIEGTEKA